MDFTDQYKHPKWQKKRLEILQRDKFKCCLCDSKKNELHVHHLIYFKNKKIWQYDNELLVSLCEKCHNFIHNEFNKIFALIAFMAIKNKIDLTDLNKLIEK